MYVVFVDDVIVAVVRFAVLILTIFFQTRERFDTTKIEAAGLMSRVQQVNTFFQLRVFY